MLNARQSFALLWKRFVAALSLVAAAALAPTATVPGGGAGAIGSRVGNGAAVANAAAALAGKIAGLAEGEQHKPAFAAAGDAPAKACALAAPIEIDVLRPAVASPPEDFSAPRQTHAARSGPTRGPPAA